MNFLYRLRCLKDKVNPSISIDAPDKEAANRWYMQRSYHHDNGEVDSFVYITVDFAVRIVGRLDPYDFMCEDWEVYDRHVA